MVDACWQIDHCTQKEEKNNTDNNIKLLLSLLSL